MSSLLDARRLEDERVELSSRRSGVMEALEEVQQRFEACKVNDFHYIFFVLNLTLLHLPPPSDSNVLTFLISYIMQMFLNVALLTLKGGWAPAMDIFL
jgi:hypothetical protein